MGYLIGTGLAVAALLLARLAGLDRDRALYPLMLIVIASYYELFAAIGGQYSALWVEAGVFAGFAALALFGFRRSPWLVNFGIGAHGIFDAVHSHLIDNPGVPSSWPAFCMSFDLAAAALIAASLLLRPSDHRAARTFLAE